MNYNFLCCGKANKASVFLSTVRYYKSTPHLKVSLHTLSLGHILSHIAYNMELNVNITMPNLIEPKIQKVINPF